MASSEIITAKLQHSLPSDLTFQSCRSGARGWITGDLSVGAVAVL